MRKPSIRRVKPEDITDAMVARCGRFWAKNAQVEFDPASARETMEEVARIGICIERGTGIAGALFLPFPWNRKFTVAYVAFWFFESARDSRVFRDLCYLCKGMGAHSINAASHFPKNRIGRFYQKLGFAPVETQWFSDQGNSKL
jgi:hypothetical protein